MSIRPKRNDEGNTPEKYKEEFLAHEQKATLQIAIGNMTANSAWSPSGVVPFDPAHGNFNLFFSARNGFWTENYRSVAINANKRVRAIRVLRDLDSGKVLYEKVDKDFPRNGDGTVKW